ncbi:hypothetical protein M569_01306, partial [Genlisea aurea]
MGPKKKPPKQKGSSSSSAPAGKPPAEVGGHKFQISAENENRLRRLLLNTERSGALSPAQPGESKEKKFKRLRSVYDKLSCDGFRDEQVELALSSLKENATYEAALDWLCLNLPGNELPLKFSSGGSFHPSEGSVGVISTANEEWVSSRDLPGDVVDENAGDFSYRIKGRRCDETLNSAQRSQADWILQYMEQQEEALLPRRDSESIIEDYCAARMQAAVAKDKGDKKGQEEAALAIREAKKEISALGLSVDILESGYATYSNYLLKDVHFDGQVNGERETESQTLSTEFGVNSDENAVGSTPLDAHLDETGFITTFQQSENELMKEPEDVELGDLFLNDENDAEPLPSGVLELQKLERMRDLLSESNLKHLEGIWKKGDPKKLPKALLHQLCQRSGWEAPKYEKVISQGRNSGYVVSILQKASGRGKSKKSGGLTTIGLPIQDESFKNPEDAQNKVAAYALNSIFPELPTHFVIPEPYSSLVLKWKEGTLIISAIEKQEDRRDVFVGSLLGGDSIDNIVADFKDISHQDKSQMTLNGEKALNSRNHSAGRSHQKVAAESIRLQKVQDQKRGMNKYKEMLQSRSKLPIAAVKDDILNRLIDNNVVVVSGETGCGKTTQVPQYILDSMIEAGHGGRCNIICTQPRRIAAISIAERVADERCESYPGSYDSLVGYQVRLDNARNERTKLLFCTTGILLRMISGNKELADVSHVIVDEVHERSLLGDFLLIVLKNLLDKRRAFGSSGLKVVLMSATVDSQLFSKYFGGCPVITAQGRLHAVSTLFLEDIYEKLEYRLTSDSPASISYGIS